MVNENFCSDKKIAAIFGLFWSKIWSFYLKIRFLDIFFESAHQICLKLGQNLGTIALDHRMAVFCLGKFLFGCFGHFWSPAARLGLWFSLHLCVRSFVRSAEISKSVHRNFLIFGTKLGLPNATEVTFSDFARKINVLANFSKSAHRIFLVLHI